MKKFLIVSGVIVAAFTVVVMILKLIGRRIFRDVIDPEVNLKVTSPAFDEGGIIPARYTGRGENVSPPLLIEGISPEAKSIAILMDDLDFPLGVYNHWIIWNIPANITSIPEAVPKGETVPELGGAIQGKSQYGGKHYYRGPLPPFGTHRYVFKFYVLDAMPDLDPDAGKLELQKAMDGHILQYGTLMGSFGEKQED